MKFQRMLFGLWLVSCSAWASANCPELFQHDFRKLHSSENMNLCETVANAKAVLVVSTASHCGFTGQFKGLEALHQQYSDRGLVVVGLPSNDFRQESKDESKTAEVCYLNYGVTFAMTAPVSVVGKSVHPLFHELAQASREPGWNFNKYLIDPDSQAVRHFGSMKRPGSSAITGAIEALLTNR